MIVTKSLLGVRVAAFVFASTLATMTSAAGQSRIEALPGWNVASDTALFGEAFVAEFRKMASQFLKQDYLQRIPDDHQPTLDAVRKKHGDPRTVAEFEVIAGMSKTFQPIREKIRFHVYGRFGLGVSAKDPARVEWVKLLEPSKK